MPAASVQCRTLKKALAAVGSIEGLAKILAVSTPELERWLAGSEDPPMPVFLNVVDFLLEPSRGFMTHETVHSPRSRRE